MADLVDEDTKHPFYDRWYLYIWYHDVRASFKRGWQMYRNIRRERKLFERGHRSWLKKKN